MLDYGIQFIKALILGWGMGVVAADFDDTTQTVSDNFALYRSFLSTWDILSLVERGARCIYV